MIEFLHPHGATPIDIDSLHLLIPEISTHEELNEFEARNIASAIQWAHRSYKLKKDLMSIQGLKLLHNKMFDSTWRWSGKFRNVNTNIGISWEQIQVAVQALCDDTQYHIANQVYPWKELAVRFHHRIVSIHPFTNGNGRHARLAADLLLRFNNQPTLIWGDASLNNDCEQRSAYIESLRKADRGDICPLLRFAGASSS